MEITRLPTATERAARALEMLLAGVSATTDRLEAELNRLDGLFPPPRPTLTLVGRDEREEEAPAGHGPNGH